jgi:magnesium chelatase family protein
MSFAKVFAAQTYMLDAHIVTVEVDLSRGLHAFSIVGLPDKAVEESRDRISAAIKNSGFTSPKSKNQKVVISLAPADLKKEGPAFDLGMALAYLLAAGDITFNSDKKLFLGELSLDGDVRPISGVLALTREAQRFGFTEIYVPGENAKESALVSDIAVFAIKNLRELIEHLESGDRNHATLAPQKQTAISYTKPRSSVCFEDIRGQASAKRGLEIAAAGGHNITLYGPPGTGKTMLAKALAHILPPLTFSEVLEVTAIHSIAGRLDNALVTNPPFRSPHHTASYVSMVGGGTIPKPGEVTLAHRGVLFLMARIQKLLQKVSRAFPV